MSRSRKHVTLGLDGDVQPPGPGQAIVRALGSRGSNVIEVEFPDGRQTLVLMPAKFNKKLWVKRGGFVMVEDSAQAEGDTKVTGTIVSVLYDDQIKQLQKMEGVWPKEFAKDGKASLEDMMPPSDSEESDQEEGQAGASAAAVAGAAKAVAAPHGGDHGEEEGEEEDDDDGLPPLQQNTNRKVVYHEVSESDDDDDDD
ncbi:hypothetical protein CHLRE_03g155800v5 [Chlamydomonas reinhardtii]|uniref:S1-like domain-containing protein n=1 Tax=Chlamydomonas reinhardtii TaxID=3055 RepID=A8J7J8_CHLRE|nr:uncharacterized protein CHLRE_03g155800v5 [Chlamydomonas reinhardtii]PNW84714.1 hypothetical protein CHLRE_03g155800v5 [Chlamydomonas reinhardtii]|eukprot:XP_001697455.1 eukaryotic initiation factor [Chlamydomonas reinhardtii]